MSDENVGGLVAKWRHMADRTGAESSADSASDELLAALRAEATAYRRCANMLEAALSAHGQPEPNGKLVGWWNGISRHDDRDGTGPSVRWGEGAENTYHDIPLYDGYNPIHYVTPPAHGQPVVDAVSCALTKLAAEFDELADAAYQECEYGRRDVWRDAAHECRNRSKRTEWITAALTGADHE